MIMIMIMITPRR